jgi:hypothetical protein
MRIFTLVCSCGHSTAMKKNELIQNPGKVFVCKGILPGTNEKCGRPYQVAKLIKIAEHTDVYTVDPDHSQLELTQ